MPTLFIDHRRAHIGRARNALELRLPDRPRVARRCAASRA
ncbi:hypothetical protein SAMN05216200_101451 [Oceanicella actignis]|uniref:Uncharacterized protein n=1 Tax=Oceanicella actignis TaxID=1189325 RepID=A0A1M7S204_9RHOB|nr:hypothetical protein SAMN04488119_10267 [Oceanicella actignis]SHN52460.1 hypothetical protein SAMN05216200_101451 [Oceanicella actignis]